MNKRLKKLTLSSAGMTMVEVMVSVTIIALAALLLFSAFSSSLNVVRRGVDYQSAGNSAFTAIEAEAAEEEEDGEMKFSAGGSNYSVDGVFLSQEETADEAAITLYSFEVEEP